MNFQKLDQYLDSLGEKYGLKGLDCKVMRSHREIYRRMWGHSDYEQKVPVSEKDLYDVYSCTKVITMTAAMQCVEAGLFALDDEAAKYIPAFGETTVSEDFVPYQWPPRWPSRKDRQHPSPSQITIRQLMTMTSGLSYDLESESILQLLEQNPNAGTVEIAGAIAKTPLLFDPGSRYAYSLGHDVVAAIIEVVTHKPYREYLQENIFRPLGLKDMLMHVPQEERGRLSAQYGCQMGSDEICRMDVGNRFRITACHDSGGAGLACTVDDYILVLDALANGGVAFNGHRLLSQESIDEMRRPQLNEAALADFTRSGKVGYSYGLGLRTLIDAASSRSPVGEFGWDGAAGAYAVIDPENKLSIFYAQEVLGMFKSYSEIHPTLRDLVYECLEG